jgi:hypothetical protein
MNVDTSGQENRPGIAPPLDADLNVSGRSQPVAVPVFNCMVYVSKDAAGGVRARVANLPGLEFTAGSEREALGKIVPAFKQRVVELLASKTQIPWIEPPAAAETGEQRRLIAVHL